MTGKLSTLDPQPLIARLMAGDSLRQIAADLSVSNVSLRAWLLREDRDAYHEAITAALTLRVAEADEKLDEAADQTSIARAREQARFARMDLERRRPSLYGQRTQMTVDLAPGLADRLRAAEGRIIDAAPLQLDNTSDVYDDQSQPIDC